MEAAVAGIVLVLSILLQFAAAVISIRLMALTGKKVGWIVFTAAFFVMAIRRGLLLHDLLFLRGAPRLLSADDLLTFIISLLFFVGLILIRPFFQSVKRSEAALKKLNEELDRRVEERTAALNEVSRSLSVLAAINRSIIHANDEAVLLSEICRAIVSVGGYRMAWIGFAEQDEAKKVKPVAQAGYEEGYLEKLGIVWSEDDERGRGPTGKAIRTGKTVVSQHIRVDPVFDPWRKDSLERGYQSSVALPLNSGEHAFGALNVYSAKEAAFGPEELERLSELADNVAYAITTLRARAQRKEIEEQLRLSEEKFYKAFQANPVMISLSRIDDGCYLDVNLAYTQLVGFSREELIGHTSIEVGIWTPEERGATVEKLLEEKHLRNLEISFKRKSGEVRDGLFSAELIEMGGENCMISVVQEVTEHKKVMREKAKLQQEQIETLKQADRLKDEFLSVISHELRTPLNAIMGFGSFLEDGGAGEMSDRQRDFVEKILKSSDRMLALVDDLLDFARMQAGTFFICPEETDFSGLAREAIASFEPAAAEKKVKLEAEIDVPRFARLDRQRIFQVLANLLANALKFTPEGGRIRVKAFLREGDLIVEVQDNGIGMAEEDVQRIFAPFIQLDMGLTRRAGGVGLGLSISRSIVEAHRGTLVAESPGPGLGSTFRLVVPIGEASS
ncbi:MAG TPA: hypothetical protein DD435_12545 [Cyanobacteria bacterium UBA8530]|nr:hypothetical protein [Cyanobacteria bacterium UBA8530]